MSEKTQLIQEIMSEEDFKKLVALLVVCDKVDFGDIYKSLYEMVIDILHKYIDDIPPKSWIEFKIGGYKNFIS